MLQIANPTDVRRQFRKKHSVKGRPNGIKKKAQEALMTKVWKQENTESYFTKYILQTHFCATTSS